MIRRSIPPPLSPEEIDSDAIEAVKETLHHYVLIDIEQWTADTNASFKEAIQTLLKLESLSR